MSESNELLVRACQVWGSARKAYRDARLEVGALLLDYFVACAAELPDDCSSKVARSRGLTREHATAAACERLGLARKDVYLLAHVAAAVKVLAGGNADVGGLTYWSLATFRETVARRAFPETRRFQAAGEYRRVRLLREEWVPSPRLLTGADPAAVFRRAVAEGWTVERCRQETRALVRKRASWQQREPESDAADLLSVAKSADPRDLADLVLSLLRACPRGGEAEELLRARLLRGAECYA